jgi:predicted DNA-binding transcriptional regulator AlpA
MEADREASQLVLSPDRAAQVLGVPARTLEAWRWRRTGPPYIKLGKRVGYRVADIESWLAAQRVETLPGRQP